MIPRGANKIGEHMRERQSKVNSEIWSQIFLAPLATCRTFRPEARNRGFVAQIREIEASVRHIPRGANEIQTDGL